MSNVNQRCATFLKQRKDSPHPSPLPMGEGTGISESPSPQGEGFGVRAINCTSRNVNEQH